MTKNNFKVIRAARLRFAAKSKLVLSSDIAIARRTHCYNTDGHIWRMKQAIKNFDRK